VRIVKQWDYMFPVITPGLTNVREALIPFLTKEIKFKFSFFNCGRMVYSL